MGHPPARGARARPDLDRVPAQALDDAKAVLVGEIVAEEDGHATGERLLAHEGLDGAPLVVAGGFELRHHLAALHFHALAYRARRFPYHGVRRAREAWREPVVQRHAVALVLEDKAGVALGEAAQRFRGAREHVRRERRPMHTPARIAAL